MSGGWSGDRPKADDFGCRIPNSEKEKQIILCLIVQRVKEERFHFRVETQQGEKLEFGLHKDQPIIAGGAIVVRTTPRRGQITIYCV